MGLVPTPYHVYDGYTLFIGGECDLSAAKRLLRNETVLPVRTTNNKALMSIWVCNFTEASLGPHHELQFSMFVSDSEIPPLPAHPLNILEILLTRADIQMMCHGLWNNTENVVAYNRELLSLNARLTDSAIERNADALEFIFKDKATGRLILSGSTRKYQKTSLRTTLALLSKFGLKKLLDANQRPWINMQVVNPLGVGLNQNLAARTYNNNNATAVRYYEPRKSRLQYGETDYKSLNFIPQFVQYMDGFKLVYLQPG